MAYKNPCKCMEYPHNIHKSNNAEYNEYSTSWRKTRKGTAKKTNQENYNDMEPKHLRFNNNIKHNYSRYFM